MTRFTAEMFVGSSPINPGVSRQAPREPRPARWEVGAAQRGDLTPAVDAVVRAQSHQSAHLKRRPPARPTSRTPRGRSSTGSQRRRHRRSSSSPPVATAACRKAIHYRFQPIRRSNNDKRRYDIGRWVTRVILSTCNLERIGPRRTQAGDFDLDGHGANHKSYVFDRTTSSFSGSLKREISRSRPLTTSCGAAEAKRRIE